MHFPTASILLGALGILAAGSGAHAAETADSRTVTMPFTECLSIIVEVSQELDEEPVTLVGTSDLVIVRINASDGFVTVSCGRADNKMTLTKSPLPEAADMAAGRSCPSP